MMPVLQSARGGKGGCKGGAWCEEGGEMQELRRGCSNWPADAEFEHYNVGVAAGMDDGIDMPQKALLKQLICLIQDEELHRG